MYSVYVLNFFSCLVHISKSFLLQYFIDKVMDPLTRVAVETFLSPLQHMIRMLLKKSSPIIHTMFSVGVHMYMCVSFYSETFSQKSRKVSPKTFLRHFLTYNLKELLIREC